MTKYIWILFVAIVLIVGCEGPAGPKGDTGSTGSTGPTGLTGPSPLNFSGSSVVNFLGEATVDLPIGFGTLSQPPVITCYTGISGAGAWLVVGMDVSVGGATAGIVWVTNHWRAVLLGGVPGWIFMVEAVWS